MCVWRGGGGGGHTAGVINTVVYVGRYVRGGGGEGDTAGLITLSGCTLDAMSVAVSLIVRLKSSHSCTLFHTPFLTGNHCRRVGGAEQKRSLSKAR